MWFLLPNSERIDSPGLTSLVEALFNVTVCATQMIVILGRNRWNDVLRHLIKTPKVWQETLVDLLGMAGRRPGLPMVVCCSTRDELDALCSVVSNISYINLTPLYSDLAESERTLILDKFRHVTMKWKQNGAAVKSGIEENEKEEQKSHMIVATDVCLPLFASGESAISSTVLINYESPTKKCKRD